MITLEDSELPKRAFLNITNDMRISRHYDQNNIDWFND